MNDKEHAFLNLLNMTRMTLLSQRDYYTYNNNHFILSLRIGKESFLDGVVAFFFIGVTFV